jgi:azurin
MAAAIIVFTKLLGPGESDTITFNAPAAGVYDYICTFPGHVILGMRGKMTVK